MISIIFSVGWHLFLAALCAKFRETDGRRFGGKKSQKDGRRRAFRFVSNKLERLTSHTQYFFSLQNSQTLEGCQVRQRL